VLFPAIITLIIIGVAIILFATELISIDLVSLLIIVLLVVFGVNTAQESIDGFSNKATITTAFMFILSATVLKTGALQFMAHRVSHIFKYNFHIGMALMMVLISIMSAFINNTPIVAIFIPVLIQIAHSSGQSPTKMLIPLSFASIFGGSCTLIGTSTNILISGIVEKYGFAEIQIFDFVAIGSIFALVGIAYMSFIGIRLLPDRKTEKNNDLNLRAYVTEIELLKDASSVGKPIMESALVKELEMDIMEITRGESSFNLPSGDFILQAGDILKVRCDVEKMKVLKNRIKIKETPSVKVGGDDFASTHSTLIEIVITSDTDIEGKTLKEIDFRRKYRATPIALKNRPDLVSNLYNVPL
jgi:di/tricarboxylate transporter